MRSPWLFSSGISLMLVAGCGTGPVLHADPAREIQVAPTDRYPDLMATSPGSVYIQRRGRTRTLRFSNTIPNIGTAHFQVRARVEGDRTIATQEILAEDGRILQKADAGSFEYHPEHNHTHVDQITRYELRRGGPDGPIVALSDKVSFCMEDTIPYGPGNKPSLYRRCTPTLQGISAGWADVYGSNVPGQELDVTNLPAGTYTLVITIDPTNKFLDANRDNNRAWTTLYLNPRYASTRRLGSSMQIAPRANTEGYYMNHYWR